MKKLMLALAVVAMTAVASATFSWDTWDNKKGDNKGCILGLSSERDNIAGAQVTICASKAKVVTSGAQVALGYNRAVKLHKGVQVGFWNNAKAAALQIGLICHNEESSFLPWFVFFNFSGKMFAQPANVEVKPAK